jgi:hypothetical protein
MFGAQTPATVETHGWCEVKKNSHGRMRRGWKIF